MPTYTTCRSCYGILEAGDGETTCPKCPKLLSHIEALSMMYLEAEENEDVILALAIKLEIDELDDQPARLHESALIYAEWGWPVFPLKPGTKVPATKNGFKDATTDSDRVDAYWNSNPLCNIGVPTGIKFDVIDVDVPLGSWSLPKLEEEGALDEIHGHCATASGGAHFYIQPMGVGNTVNLEPGIDYRGIGGYVVVPPSHVDEMHPDTLRHRAWSWVTQPSPSIKGKHDI
jgi:hypothetical protein